MPPVQGLRGATLRGIGWSTVGTVVIFAVNVITLLLLARLLTPSEFGVVGAGMAIVSLARSLADTSIGQAVVSAPTLDSSTVRSASALAIAAGTITAVALGLATPSLEAALNAP